VRVVAEYVVEFGKDGQPVEPDGRLDAASFHRNHQSIWAVLEKFLDGKSGDVLEAGSGTGQHVIDFARRSPEITWWPSDFNDAHLKSIAAWRAHGQLPDVRPPLRIDLSDPAWCPEMHDGSGPGGLLAVFCANVIHIAPWRVAEGLFAGAAHYLRADGRLFLYGPFKRDGKHTAPAMRHSIPACGTTIPNGACGTSPTSGRSPIASACASLKSLRCPPTILFWCSND
jgi:SAM-dependent methyltransferase